MGEISYLNAGDISFCDGTGGEVLKAKTQGDVTVEGNREGRIIEV